MKSSTSQHEQQCGEIFIVEDNADSLKVLSTMLMRAGYSVRHAADGKQALENIQAQAPDMVLMDVNVPSMNGIEICCGLRAARETKNIPIIFISDQTEAELKVTALEAGGSDYITKPFHTAEIMIRIQMHMRLYLVQKELADRTLDLTREVDEHKHAQQALRESFEYINNSPAVSFLWKNAEAWPVEYVSDNVVDLFGYTAEDFQSGRVLYGSLIHKDDREQVADEVQQYSLQDHVHDMMHEPYRIHAKDGTVRWIKDRTRLIRNSDGDVTHYQGVVLDISKGILASTERKKLQNDVLQNEKMASIGQLAAGVAHEINNPIGYILSNLNTMEEYLEDIQEYFNTEEPQSAEKREEVLEMLTDFGDAVSESLEGANRVKTIVSDMKGFSRADSGDKSMIDINEGLAATLNIVWNQLKYHCEVIKEYGELPEIECYPGRLNQVFLNMLVNAGQAIGEEQGVITIKTWADDDNIYIMIRDTGCGISEENQSELFNAFYTTKDVGVGTGLGLSLSHDIVSKHGGDITVKSVVGEWTEFVVSLPICGVPATELIPAG